MANALTTTGGTTATGLHRLTKRLGLTARPETFRERLINSSAVWLALMLYWVISDVVIALFPPDGRPVSPQGLPIHLGATLLGLAAIWCMHRADFPAAWDARIPAQRRLLFPALIGVGFGVLLIGVELSFGLVRSFQAANGVKVTIGFPQSILVYSSIAPFLELQYLLLPVAVLLWLISAVLLRGRGQAPTFWVLALLASAIEPALQLAATLGSAAGGVVSVEPVAFGLVALMGFAVNFSAAVMLRRYGLLGPIILRVGSYMVWHVFFGTLFL